MIKRIWSFPAFCLLVMSQPTFVSANEPGFADEVLGSWDLTVHAPGGDYPSWLEVRLRTERELMARFVGRFGSTRYLPSITYRDGVLEFTAPAQYESHDLRFVASLEGDRLAGKTFDAEGNAIAFSGVRTRARKVFTRPPATRPSQLFDGKSLVGWLLRHDRHRGCWQVENGIMKATPPCVDLISTARVNDFRLEVEFRYPEGSNSGIYLRGRYEIQIQDDHGKALDPLRMGAVYGFIAPSVDATQPAGTWQTYAITLVGRTVTVVLNGETVIDSQVIPGITGGALDSRQAAPGPIMLQGDHGPIEFRRITLTPL